MKTFVVLGMHRSATSLIAKALHDQGVHMGKRLMGPGHGNPKGHYECLDVVAVNDAILLEAGGSWGNPPTKQAILEQEESFSPIIEQVVRNEISAAERKGKELWGFKDPRTALTIDLWLPYLPHPHLIYIKRAPREVAQSLNERDGTPIEQGMALSKVYNERIQEAMEQYGL